MKTKIEKRGQNFIFKGKRSWNFFLFFFLFFWGSFLFSCSSNQRNQVLHHSQVEKVSQKTASQEVAQKVGTKKSLQKSKGKSPSFFQGIILPGEVSLLKFEASLPKKGKLICDKKEIGFFFKEETLYAFVSETYFSDYKSFDCFYHYGKGTPLKIAHFKVLPKQFPAERLQVDKKRVFLSRKNQLRANRERSLRYKAYAHSSPRPYFFGPFQRPLNAHITSIYGAKRIFNNKKQTQHLGTDYRAAVGVPIKTTNRGKVVVSRDFFYTGNTIIIDHGLGIFTMYGHLSKRMVQEGEIIPEKTIIGLAGATGRVTGPHLHWGVTVNNLAVDGESLIKTSQALKSL